MQDAPGKFLENPHQKLRLTLSSSPNYKLLTDERKTQRATHIREGSSRNDSYWFLAAVERGKGFEANYTRTEIFQGAGWQAWALLWLMIKRRGIILTLFLKSDRERFV